MVPMLLANGHNVKGLDTNYFEECKFTETQVKIPEIIKDIRDVNKGDVENFDAIIHLAALSNDPLGDLNPKATYEINHEASVHLARISKKVGVSRFIYMSSASVYGNSYIPPLIDSLPNTQRENKLLSRPFTL